MLLRNSAIAVLIVIAGLLPLSPIADPQLLSNVLSLVSLVAALALCVRVDNNTYGRSYRLPLNIDVRIAAPLIVLWILFILTTVLAPSTAGILRTVAYIFASAVCVFVFAPTIPRSIAYRTFAWAGGLITLVGLPSLRIEDFHVGPIEFSAIGATYRVFGVWNVHNPASIYHQPNSLAFLAVIGLVSALAIVARSDDLRTKLGFSVLAALCAVGVLVTRSRAVWGALGAVGGLYVVYTVSRGDRRILAAALTLGTIGFAFVLASLVGMLPEPFDITVPLHSRGLAWGATVEAAMHRPLIGWGPGNTVEAISRYSPTGDRLTGNSYLRMFAMTGLIGGIAYLALCASALASAVDRIRLSEAHAIHAEFGFATLGMLVIVLFFQAFAGLTLFGFAQLSLVGMLFVGYAQREAHADQMITLNRTVAYRLRWWVSEHFRWT